MGKQKDWIIRPLEGLPPKEFVRIPNAALIAECSEAKIRRLLETRTLKTYKLGRCTLVSVRELLGLIKAA